MHTFTYNDRTALVKTTGGTVRGYEWDGLLVFKGIPYAKAARFHRPEPVSWEGTRDCSSFGYVCPLLTSDRPNGEVMVPHRYWPMNEDCQNLNIWTPAADAAKRPVMVWLHGGGYEAGSAIEHLAYEGENMAREGDCVVVSINHRLNILGYFDLSDYGEEYENSGNAGGDDILAALRWIHDNIAAFGGDPDNVILFGQSGGGAKITTLLQTPEADGLYAAGVIMSGVIGPVLADQKGSGKDLAEALMKELSIADVKDLETVPYADLAAAYNKVKPALAKEGKYTGGAPHPNRFYLGDPLEHGFRKETEKVPLVVGSVYGEFTSFMPMEKVADGLPEEAYAEILEKELGKEGAAALIPLFEKAYPERKLTDLVNLDFIFRVPELQYVKLRAAKSDHVFVYLFNRDEPINDRQTPWHCSDVPYVFHNIDLVPYTQPDYAAQEKLEEEIFGSLMNFARTKNPDGSLPEGEHWKASTPESVYTCIFDAHTRVRENFDAQLMEVLPRFMGPVMQRKMAQMMGDGAVQH